MVPDSSDATFDEYDEPTAPETDGGSPGFDEAALYIVVREAVTDALLDVIGTLLLVGVAFVLVVAGGRAVVESSSPVGAGLGVVLAAGGFYLAAATLELVPPIRTWFRAP